MKEVETQVKVNEQCDRGHIWGDGVGGSSVACGDIESVEPTRGYRDVFWVNPEVNQRCSDGYILLDV